MGEEKKPGQDLEQERMEEKKEEEEIKRISQLNPATGCGRNEDRFPNR